MISVNGTGVVSLPPDLAIVSGTIQTYDGHSASAAVGANSDIYNRVVDSVVAVGVARGDVTLSSYDLSYNPPPNDRPGYTVTRNFIVRVHQIALAGNVVDAATQAGASGIGVAFGLSSTTAASQEAMQRAVADATASAGAVASAAHLHIVGVSQIQVGSAYVPSPQPRVYMAAEAHAPTTFDTGNTTVTQTVTIIFLAKP